MQYRRLGKRVTEEISALGFGCMRFPTADDKIDREKTYAMLEYAVANGVNYLDTAYPYHGGESEEVVGEFLSRGYRDKVLLATKMPSWKVEEPADLDVLFEEQLAKLRVDHVDFYLLHALNAAYWETYQKVDALSWLERMKKAGKIRYAGFSFHDSFSVFTEIVDGYDAWDICQIQYNYMNETIQAGTAGLAYAASKGIGVVVMEPLLGGALADPPQEVRDALSVAGGEDYSPVERAFRWLWDKDDVGIALSGMSSMEQVVQNVEYANRSGTRCLTDAERGGYKNATTAFEALRPVPCTSCGYCTPCPNGVDIPGNFRLLNDLYMFGIERQSKWRYNTGMAEEKRASACIECGECEPKCPQQIPIIESLKQVHSELVTVEE